MTVLRTTAVANMELPDPAALAVLLQDYSLHVWRLSGTPRACCGSSYAYPFHIRLIAGSTHI